VQQTRSRGTIPGAHLSATQILQQANATVVPAAPLFDIVYRIPEASLRLARDDRQAKFYYQTERIKAMQGAGAVPAPETPHPSRWYNIKVDGRQMQVLVNHYGQASAARPERIGLAVPTSSHLRCCTHLRAPERWMSGALMTLLVAGGRAAPLVTRLRPKTAPCRSRRRRVRLVWGEGRVVSG
jgi:hypothetical protein